MKNPYNRIAVWYKGKGFRFRSCQTTVCPTTKELGSVTNFNAWTKYIRRSVEEIEAGKHALTAAKVLLETI